MAQCRPGSTLRRLLKVTNVHENCTAIRRSYTAKYRDKRETIQRQESILLHPGEFRVDNGWEPSLLQAVLWASRDNIRRKYPSRYYYFSGFV